ncbi:hypothetical protein P9869_04810 [Streptomyces ossamyceticus]|nr:hypothetical protein [Streptomyces ossamyceticus]
MHSSAIRRLSTLALGLGLTVSAVVGTVSTATPAAAAIICENRGGTVYVVEDTAPVRTTYYETGRVVDWVFRGERLNYDKTCRNNNGNLWYWLDRNPRHNEGWIYSGNVARI